MRRKITRNADVQTRTDRKSNESDFVGIVKKESILDSLSDCMLCINNVV